MGEEKKRKGGRKRRVEKRGDEKEMEKHSVKSPMPELQ